MSICSSRHLSLAWKGNEANPTLRFLFYFIFFIFSVELLLCLLALWVRNSKVWAAAPLASSPCSSTLPLLVAGSIKPTALLSLLLPEQVGHGQRGSEKGGRLKVVLSFLFCRAEQGLWHPIPAESLPPAVNRHWAHTLAASSAYCFAAAIRSTQ